MKENNQIICQSCSMPLINESDKGTNKDGSLSVDYCKHCLEAGNFVGYTTLEEAIADSVNYAKQAGMTKEEMLSHAKEFLPTLKRWSS